MNDHKHPGLTLDSKLTFVNHISEKARKALKGVRVIKYIFSYVPTNTLDQIYKIYVRLHLDFCDVIYHTPKMCNLFDSSFRLSNIINGSIEMVQYHPALAVTDTCKGDQHQ